MTKVSRATANSSFALWGLTYFVETFVVKQTLVLRINISVKKFPQCNTENRLVQALWPTKHHYKFRDTMELLQICDLTV